MTLSPPTDARTPVLVADGVRLIEQLQHPDGAYPASPTFSAYSGYSWFRDGAFIADAMSSAGRVGSAERFFDWCAAVLTDRAGMISEIVRAQESGAPLADSSMLPTRFTFAGDAGSDEWWDFQLDGYGTWLWAVAEHARRHHADTDRWRPALALTVDYLAASWQRPCFDWWEEHAEHVHVSTLGCIAAGLRAVGEADIVDPATAARARRTADEILSVVLEQGVVDGHLVKWLGTAAVDASLAALVGLMDLIPAASAVGRGTIAAIERDLTVDGGVHRFLDDTYFGGGQWPLLSCFLGIAHARSGDLRRARQLLDWAGATAADDGDMPEQVEHHLLAPNRVREWVDRWGPSARPLLWSHAMYIRLAVELGTATSSEKGNA